ncbi:MAG: hypothetical protein KKC64_03170 [Spirochaetes bacterium]|nr:hypothetical protein [Spirochaetota bacterium]
MNKQIIIRYIILFLILSVLVAAAVVLARYAELYSTKTWKNLARINSNQTIGESSFYFVRQDNLKAVIKSKDETLLFTHFDFSGTSSWYLLRYDINATLQRTVKLDATNSSPASQIFAELAKLHENDNTTTPTSNIPELLWKARTFSFSTYIQPEEREKP